MRLAAGGVGSDLTLKLIRNVILQGTFSPEQRKDVNISEHSGFTYRPLAL